MLYKTRRELRDAPARGWTAREEKLRNERKDNVAFYQAKSPFSATSFRSYRLVAVVVLQNVKYSEEHFVDYGYRYEFN